MKYLTNAEIADILDVPVCRVATAFIARKEYIKNNFDTYVGIAYRKRGGGHARFTEERIVDYIRSYFREVENKNYIAEVNKKEKEFKKQLEIERLKKEHPLVKDVRFFDLEYFPDLTLHV